MNRYLVFRGYRYHYSGGWSDFVDSYASFDDACKKAQSLKNLDAWVEVVDLETETVVFEG